MAIFNSYVGFPEGNKAGYQKRNWHLHGLTYCQWLTSTLNRRWACLEVNKLGNMDSTFALHADNSICFEVPPASLNLGLAQLIWRLFEGESISWDARGFDSSWGPRCIWPATLFNGPIQNMWWENGDLVFHHQNSCWLSVVSGHGKKMGKASGIHMYSYRL